MEHARKRGMRQSSDNTNTSTRASVRRGKSGRRGVAPGEELYLWLLVALEVTALGVLRHVFRRRHGG